jgi:hypothetical protein
MENLVITGNSNIYLIPQVHFDATTGNCEIVGESYLEETKEFYQKLVKWLQDYMTEVKGNITLSIKLTYFNTSTSRCLLDIFRILKTYQLQKHEVTVNWYVKHEEDFSVEEVEDFIVNSGLMINQILY